MENNDTEARRYFEMRMQDISEAKNCPDKLDDLWNDCLAIDATIKLNVQLSTGGPGDGFEIICDACSGEPLYGNHYFVQWGYCRECVLSEDELSGVCAAYAIEDGRNFLKSHIDL
ncbi:MAG TPA: hypothetical protein VG347_08520 [Verrucomicrobiae bacterium]|nr:hypothetical protein [Verrucomicrobiae bacterium]